MYAQYWIHRLFSRSFFIKYKKGCRLTTTPKQVTAFVLQTARGVGQWKITQMPLLCIPVLLSTFLWVSGMAGAQRCRRGAALWGWATGAVTAATIGWRINLVARNDFFFPEPFPSWTVWMQDNSQVFWKINTQTNNSHPKIHKTKSKETAPFPCLPS